VFEGTSYEKGTLTLEPEDCLLLYTDGVTEAMNKKGDFFSDEGLIRSLHGANGYEPKETLDRILGDVKTFAAGAPPSDDITILALKYKGPTKP
jgi:sigma-B regulation protein RsbU (phosphoserine phosphatase)